MATWGSASATTIERRINDGTLSIRAESGRLVPGMSTPGILASGSKGDITGRFVVSWETAPPMSIRKRSWTNSKGELREAWVVDYVDKIERGKRRLKTFEKK